MPKRTLSYKVFSNPFFVLLLFSISAFSIYSNTLDSTFHYDSIGNIVDNKYIHWDEISLENIKILFALDRPISNLTFALNYYVNGLDVRGFHYVNIGIHILSAFGFFLFLNALFICGFGRKYREKSSVIALIAALFWLSSPLQTQSVTYIVQRMAELAAMFYIYAMYFYLKGRLSSGGNRYVFYALTFISTLLAFGSKQNAFTLPFYLLLFEIIVVRRGKTDFLLKKKVIVALSLFVLAFIGALWHLYYFPFEVQPGSWLIYQVKTRLFTGVRVMVFYIGELLFPIPSKLSLIHDFKVSRSFLSPPSTIFAFVLVVSLILYAVKSLKRHPLSSFFILWFIGNLAMETFSPYLIFVFEHRLYLPSMGFFALAAIGYSKCFKFAEERGLQWLAISALLVIVVTFSVSTYNRNKIWKNDYTLWSDVIAKNPNSVKGYLGVGAFYAKNKDYREALSYYIKAKSTAPRNSLALYGLGIAYFELKMYDEAVKEFAYLGSMGYPGFEKDTVNYYFSKIARNYYGHGKVKEALETIGTALRYDPDEPKLKELRKEMEEGTLTFEEIMQK